jgi:hypothetical protein
MLGILASSIPTLVRRGTALAPVLRSAKPSWRRPGIISRAGCNWPPAPLASAPMQPLASSPAGVMNNADFALTTSPSHQEPTWTSANRTSLSLVTRWLSESIDGAEQLSCARLALIPPGRTSWDSR